MRTLALLLLPTAILLAQPTAFEVVSIKPNASNDNRIMIRMAPGGTFTANGATLKILISQAFNIRDFQITGGPGWIGSDRYDINAKGPEGMPDRVPPDVLRPMLKSLIEDRFQLKYHMESKELPVFVLTQAKGGHKMTVVEEVAPAPGTGGGPGRPPQRVMIGRGGFTGESVPIAFLVQQLSQVLGRTVIDKTGLPGTYKIDLQWTPEPGPGSEAGAGADNSGPTIFTALQEKLGLKLDSQKGPVDILVIDSVAKPTEN
jgi:uncharacterized protein (TIGR03435 family)